MAQKTPFTTIERGETQNRTQALFQAGQSTWLDFISACIIQDGTLQRMV
jgi:hypothetical protein